MFDRIVDDETQRVRAQCKACGRQLVPQVKRMANVLRKHNCLSSGPLG